jgi:hypothetical protein
VSRATSAGGSQFKVVASKRESLLPNSGHPTGWVNRADDAKAAETSNEWRSDAYVPLMFPGEMAFLTGAIGVDLISNPAPLPLRRVPRPSLLLRRALLSQLLPRTPLMLTVPMARRRLE